MATEQPRSRPNQEHPQEILRQASVVLQGRVVTLWEGRSGGVAVVLASTPAPRHTLTALDVDSTLGRWGIPVVQGAQWLGCRVGANGRWCLAPVRRQPADPPPGGVERRSHVAHDLRAGRPLPRAG